MTSPRIRSFGLIALATAALAGPLAEVAQATPVASNGAPTIAGTMTQGGVLTVTPGTYTGDSTPTVSEQWTDCSSAASSSCTSPIAGATGNTYTLQSTDVGKWVAVVETASNTDSTTMLPTSATQTSNVIGQVTPPPPANTPPVPAPTGTVTNGQVLTASDGTWSNSPTSFTYQWVRCTSGCVSITTNGTAKTYALTDADVGATIEVQITARNSNATPSVAATSQPTAAIGAATPTNTTPPSITGATTLGQVLTETGDVWTGSPTSFTYQWLRCNPTCASITTNGTSKTYTLVAADVGDTIEVQMTASNSNPTPSAVVTSAPTAAVVPPPPSIVAAPTISGTAQLGNTLTEGAAKWGTTWPPASTAVQWYRCDSRNLNCVAIAAPAGVAKTYTLTATDVGATIQVAETATNAGGSTTNYSGFSNPVLNADSIVPPPTLVAGSSPAIAGSAQLGRTLTGSGAQFTNNPGTFNYQWLRCNALGCAPIPGATDKTYTPTSADVGDSMAFAETAGNSGGASDTVQSSRTDTITAPSTTALQTNSSAPVAGQAVTLIATVTSAAGSLRPAGTVNFRDNGAPISGCTSLTLGNSAPTAVCQTSFLASVANVTAEYSAARGTFITGSTSSPTRLTVGRAATTITVAASAHVSLGNRTTYTATVHPPADSSLTPTGRVRFTDGGKRIKGCGSKALAEHGAPCSVKYLGLKQHRIAAHYSGDANFAPSASITSHVLVQPQAPSGFVAVFMNWSFGYSLHSTRIKSLSASGLSAGIHITVTCSGSGCPFARRAITVSARGKCGKAARRGCVAAPSFNLTPIFHRAHLRVGTQLTVAVTHRGWVGKYYRFTIRAGHKPAIDVSCLAVNGTRPGVGCRAR